MITRTYYCDGPLNPDFPHPDGEVDRCPCHATAYRGLPAGMLRVTWETSVLHFCSWDCCLRYASRQEPTTVIQWDDA